MDSDPFDAEGEAPPPRSTGPLIVGLLGLAAFLAVELLALRSYCANETRPPAWDQSVHLEIALDYKNAWADRDISKIWQLAPKPGMPPFPPLYHLGMALLMDPADPVATSLRINWLYLALLALGIFGVAYEYRPQATALAAAMAFVCTPVVQRLFHTQLVDLPVAAVVALSYWALLKSEGFKKWPGSLAFGALFAAGMMHKWSYFSYMVPAYIMGATALFERKCRLKALAAAALALAGCAPWYVTHLPILVPRLAEASNDFGTPVWKGLGMFQYFLESVNSFGLPMFLMGWLGLCMPDPERNRDRVWVLLSWVFFSYAFWAIVPNRQMRFLLPGLVPLGACLAVASWPKEVVWVLAGIQAVLTVNFSTGWIAPATLRLPLQPVELFSSDPPRREDWKIADILRAASAKRDAARPASNVTLVANDTFFNGPNFNWVLKREKVPGLAMRGVNSRLCEFSEFLVLKKGYLGPEKVIQRLPEAAGLILSSDSWVAASYETAGTWPLPDQSEAVLYQQRKFRKPPIGDAVRDAVSSEPLGKTAPGEPAGRWPGMKEPAEPPKAKPRKQQAAGEKQMTFAFYTSTAVTATDLVFRFGPWLPAKGFYEPLVMTAKQLELKRLEVSRLSASPSAAVVARDLALDFGPWRPEEGAFERVGFSAGQITVNGMALSGIDLELEGLNVIPLMDRTEPESPYIYDVRFLKLKTLRVKSASVSAAMIRAFLERRIKGIVIKRFDLEKNAVLDATINGITFHAEVGLSLKDNPRRLVLDVVRFEVGVTPVPASLLGVLSSVSIPLDHNPETPFGIELPGLTVKDGMLTVP